MEERKETFGIAKQICKMDDSQSSVIAKSLLHRTGQCGAVGSVLLNLQLEAIVLLACGRVSPCTA